MSEYLVTVRFEADTLEQAEAIAAAMEEAGAKLDGSFDGSEVEAL